MVQGVEIKDGFLYDRDPSNDELIEKVKVSTPEDVNSAIAKAKAAQPAWARVPLEERVALLKSAVAKLLSKKDALTKMMTREMGKLPSEATMEVDDATAKDRFFELLTDANRTQVVKTATGAESFIMRDPLGVVAVLSPWNFPVDEILLLALPALAAGNAVVVKPSEVVPLTGALVVGTIKETLPDGVVHLLQGDGAVGSLLTNHAEVNMIAMTGSSATGKKIMESASSSLKRLVLELGGKDPMVIFADADLNKAVEDAVIFSLFNCGQVCCSVERIYVEKSLKPKFEKELVKYLETKFESGELQIPPMVSKLQRDLVSQHISDAKQKGAKVLFEQKLDLNKTKKGNWFPAVALSDITPSMRVYSEETFGPVICLCEFDGSEAEAVRLGNDTEYGLSASVYSSDIQKAVRVAGGIKAGQVGVNNWPLANAPKECPWVGHRQSGYGFHSGLDGWRQFSVPKSVISTTSIHKL